MTTETLRNRFDALMAQTKDQIVAAARSAGFTGDENRYTITDPDGQQATGKAAVAWWLAIVQTGEPIIPQQHQQQPEPVAPLVREPQPAKPVMKPASADAGKLAKQIGRAHV